MFTTKIEHKMQTGRTEFVNGEILQMLWDAVERTKGYASFWDWPEKSIKERGVVRELLGAIRAEEGQHGIRTLNANKFDPPDCIGISLQGERVGFEVTELVDQATVERNRRGYPEWKEWTPEELLAKVGCLLVGKDGKRLQGGPFDRYVVVIHTDEPLLQYEECAAILRGRKFGPFQQIDEAFFLFAPEPGRDSYPFLRLELT